MNPLTQTINQRKMNERELEAGVSGTKNSWHMEYKDSAWIFLGGLPYEMTEGDVICMFSQYGEVVHINLIRDHGTGKSKGFGFLCYMDQRSTILAVDNLNGVKVLSRMIRVDHVHQYKLPKDLEKLDQDKRKLFEEGCAPKEIDIEFSESSEEEFVTKPKKEKKKKKQKRRRRHSTSSESESDSEDDRRKRDKNKMKDRNNRNGKQEQSRNNRDKVKQEEKSLEERLKDMADYVRSGETRAGENKRMSAKDMFVKEERRMRDRSGSVKRASMRRSRTRSRDRRARSRSSQRRERRRRSRSNDRQKSKNYRSSSRGRERRRRESSSSGSESNDRRRR